MNLNHNKATRSLPKTNAINRVYPWTPPKNIEQEMYKGIAMYYMVLREKNTQSPIKPITQLSACLDSPDIYGPGPLSVTAFTS